MRKNGFYWAKMKDMDWWEVYEFEQGYWTESGGQGNYYYDQDFEFIDEIPLFHKDQKHDMIKDIEDY